MGRSRWVEGRGISSAFYPGFKAAVYVAGNTGVGRAASVKSAVAKFSGTSLPSRATGFQSPRGKRPAAGP